MNAPAPELILPTWTTEEIQQHLESNAKMLEEWTKLLDKDELVPPDQVTIDNISRHNVLRRKLHENLGTLAKMVQTQLKARREAIAAQERTASAGLSTSSQVGVPTMSASGPIRASTIPAGYPNQSMQFSGDSQQNIMHTQSGAHAPMYQPQQFHTQQPGQNPQYYAQAYGHQQQQQYMYTGGNSMSYTPMTMGGPQQTGEHHLQSGQQQSIPIQVQGQMNFANPSHQQHQGPSQPPPPLLAGLPTQQQTMAGYSSQYSGYHQPMMVMGPVTGSTQAMPAGYGPNLQTQFMYSTQAQDMQLQQQLQAPQGTYSTAVSTSGPYPAGSQSMAYTQSYQPQQTANQMLYQPAQGHLQHQHQQQQMMYMQQQSSAQQQQNQGP